MQVAASFFNYVVKYDSVLIIIVISTWTIWITLCDFNFHCNICKILLGHFAGRKVDSANASSLPKDLHGAPPESFITNLADVTGRMKSLRKMALLWCKIVAEVSILYKTISYSIFLAQRDSCCHWGIFWSLLYLLNYLYRTPAFSYMNMHWTIRPFVKGVASEEY